MFVPAELSTPDVGIEALTVFLDAPGLGALAALDMTPSGIVHLHIQKVFTISPLSLCALLDLELDKFCLHPSKQAIGYEDLRGIQRETHLGVKGVGVFELCGKDDIPDHLRSLHILALHALAEGLVTEHRCTG